MSHSKNPDLEIRKLRALLEQRDAAHREEMRSKNEDLLRAQQEISQLQTSVYHSQIAQSPSPSGLGASTVHNEFHLSSSATTPATPFNQDGMSRSNTVPRSNGVHGHSRHESVARPSNRHGNNAHAHAIKRARTMSQQAPASQKMDRLGSNLSTQSAGPFTGNGPISPPPRAHNAGAQMRSASMTDYVDRGEPTPSYALVHSQSMRSSQSKHRHDMPTLSESGPMTGVMLDPEVYFAQNPFPEEPPPSMDCYGSSVPSQGQDVEVPQFNITNVSVCGSMTTAPTYDTAPMTRQNSLFDNQSVSGGVRMMSLGSQMSQGGEAYYQDGSQHNSSGDNSPLGKRPYCSEDALIAVGSSLAPPYAHQYAASAPTDALLASSDMERSISSASMASTRSNSSLKARAKDTLKQQCQRALAAPLKPKPSAEQTTAESQANAKKDGKAAITKTKYVRPKQPKVYCDQCDEHKDGFRGEHELRRHRDAKHQATVKKWICVDPAAHGLPIGVPAVNPLAKCKACKAQKKYGAYYNAAAHLRRTHFKEKPSRQKNKGGNGNGGARSDEDKRGGKGGGDWPPMSELKNWMKEIWVNKYEVDDEDDADDDAGHAMADAESGGMESYTAEFGVPHHKIAANMFAEVDYSNLVVNTDVAYLNGAMPLSSADFNFNNNMSPSTMSPNFASDLSAISPEGHMNQYSSALSSSATVTPMTAYHEVSHMDDFDFNMVYPQ